MSTEVARTDDKATQANGLIKKYALGSAAVGAIPFPLIDVGLLFGVQLKMLHHLCRVYETPFSSEQGRAVVASLLGGGGSIGAGTWAKSAVSSLIKSVPLVGSITGIVATSGCGYATTLAIGKVFVQHFETGGTLLSFNADKLKQHYAEHFGTAQRASVAGGSYVGVKP